MSVATWFNLISDAFFLLKKNLNRLGKNQNLKHIEWKNIKKTVWALESKHTVFMFLVAPITE